MATRRCVVRVPTDGDISHVTRHLRESDALELRDGGDDPATALRASVDMSTYVRAMAEEDGPAFAVWGVGPTPSRPEAGIVWLLATDALDAHRVAFGRAVRRDLANLRRGYRSVGNYVHASNARSIRWLESLGFFVSVWPASEGAVFRFFTMPGEV